MHQNVPEVSKRKRQDTYDYKNPPPKKIFLVRFEVLTQVTIKSVILWDVTPYILFQRNFPPPSPDYMQSHPRR